MTFQLYWGDLHSHCSISYGLGTIEQAVARAREQLDFCSVTGHAFWPDMPSDRDRYGPIIDYHRQGFATLARNWPQLLDASRAASADGRFLVMPSYEWHSLQYGDHNVYAAGPDLELADAPDLPGLRQMAARDDRFVIPHHIGYAAGYRGIDWRHFREDQSPFVEVMSLHGCSVSERSPFPMLHDMGPRDQASTAEAGWAAGHRFGIVGGTDHHGAYPGSHGDGRMGVFATALTRAALWEAFRARRVFAATGDRIDARMFVNDAWIGDTALAPATRTIVARVHACDAIDTVRLIKNGHLIERGAPAWDTAASSGRFRLRVTWGWGRKDEPVPWLVTVTLRHGAILRVESCFSGQSVAAPKGVGGHTASADQDDLPHAILESAERHCTWRSVTTGNPSLRHAATQALSFEIEADPNTKIVVDTGDERFEHSAGELLAGGRVHYRRGWLSEAIRIGPLVPVEQCRFDAEWHDAPDQPVDVYRLEVVQHNGQCAWLTPVWVAESRIDDR